MTAERRITRIRSPRRTTPGGSLTVEIVFVLRGETVNPDEVENVRERAILREIERSIRARVGELRCSEHGVAPKLTATGGRADALEFDLAGCCQDLIDETTAALA